MNTQENNKSIAEIIYQRKSNKMIAEFMKHSHPLLPSRSTINYLAEDLEYDNDWNWLMTVVEKIKNIAVEDENIEVFYEVANHIPDRHETYNAVLEFIKEYNKNK